MALIKKFKDQLIKALSGPQNVPRGLVEIQKYFRLNSGIDFDIKKHDDLMIAVSTNFRHGSILAQGKDEEELEKNISDAILTSFEVPSSYAKEAGIHKVGELSQKYALA